MAQIPFTVSAKTARLIGRENFANADGAVIELVKNSYDSEATKCVVLISPIDDSIYVIDSGEGMTQGIILEHWMNIGTDNKNTNVEAVGKRVKTGAKGIGRFALDRLGKSCEVRTKTKDGVGVQWKIDWTQFEQPGKKFRKY